MPRLGKFVMIAAIPIAAVIGVAGLLVAFCPPASLQTLHTVTDPFARMDLSSLPAIQRYRARDGKELAYRTYAGTGDEVVMLVHGSSGSSQDMHLLAQALQKETGATVLVPDLRGHGANTPHGDISYVGQLDDDMVDLVDALKPRYANRKWILLGFSSGGGFALRMAGGAHGNMFDRYLLISPYLRHDAPTARPQQGNQKSGWYDVSVPRIIGLSILDFLGIHHFDGLPVLSFAVSENAAGVTSRYSFRMQQNFQPHDDYMADIRQTSKPMEVLVGSDDQLFLPDQFAKVFDSQGKNIPVVIVPGMGHADMITKPEAIRALVNAVRQSD